MKTSVWIIQDMNVLLISPIFSVILVLDGKEVPATFCSVSLTLGLIILLVLPMEHVISGFEKYFCFGVWPFASEIFLVAL